MMLSRLLREIVFAGLIALGVGFPVAYAQDIEDSSGIVPGDTLDIVGGSLASIAEFPFLVQVSPNGGLCGGSLISDSWVVTAAHCTYNISTSNISVTVGTNQLSSGGVTRSVTQKIEHPSYNPSTYDNDIALLRLSAPVPEANTGSINWLSNNESALMPEGSMVTVAGWGTTSAGGNVSENLLKVSVEMNYHSTCAAESSYVAAGYSLTENMICAGVTGGGKDSCQGDSGGPLMVYHNGQPKLAGIVSWGVSCAAANYPGVYTRVANYADWISAQSGIANGGTDISSGDGTCLINAQSARTGTEFEINLTSGCDANSAPAFDAAAEFWANFLYSSVPIKIEAQFAPLQCDENGIVLGSAGAWNYLYDTTGSSLPEANTWYTYAHTNSLVGYDVKPSEPDIFMQFNSALGSTSCPTDPWYFDDGSAPSTPSDTIDLYGTIQHEIAHGLGFASLLNSSGAKGGGLDDVYSNRLYEEGVGLLRYMSSNSDRAAAMISNGDLTWSGASVDGLAGSLSAGTKNGNVQMYAPNPYRSGSSVSHFSTALEPKELMRPFKTTRTQTNFLLSKNLFRDIGWMTIPDAPSITSISAGSSYLDVAIGAPYHLGNSLLITYTAQCGNQSKSGTSSVLRVSGLSPQTQYSCSLTVTTAAGKSDPSAIVQKSTNPAQPPGNAQIDSVETYGDEATFQISLSTGTTVSTDLYKVECTAPNGATVSGDSTNSSVTVSGLNDGIVYTCKAFAQNAAGPGGSATTQVTVDGAISGLPIWLLYQASKSQAGAGAGSGPQSQCASSATVECSSLNLSSSGTSAPIAFTIPSGKTIVTGFSMSDEKGRLEWVPRYTETPQNGAIPTAWISAEPAGQRVNTQASCIAHGNQGALIASSAGNHCSLSVGTNYFLNWASCVADGASPSENCGAQEAGDGNFSIYIQVID